MSRCATRVGDAYFRTPRTTLKEFVNLLAVLEQNPGIGWAELIDRVDVAPEVDPSLTPLEDQADGGEITSSGTAPNSTLPAPGAQQHVGDGDDDLATLRI